MGITPQPAVGLCGSTHLAWGSQELSSWLKSHFSEYDTSCKLQTERWRRSASTVLFNKGETEKVEEMQVRESGVPDSCHRKSLVSSLDADHGDPGIPLPLNCFLCMSFETGSDTRLWICVLTDSGATRRPRVPFPKSTCTNPWILEVFKRKRGPKRKPEANRQGDDVSCASAE